MSFLRRLLGRNVDTAKKTPTTRVQDDVDSAASPQETTTTIPSTRVDSSDTAVGPSQGQDGAKDRQRAPSLDTKDLGNSTDAGRSRCSMVRPFAAGLRVGYASDIGQLRDHNEDSLIAFQGSHLGDNAGDPFGFFVVADGMGGHNAGEVASSLAARTVGREVLRRVYLPYLREETPNADMVPLIEILRDAVRKANDLVHQKVPGGGTTLTCALILGRRAYIAHVGDSRAYLLENSAMQQVTQDHSYVGRLIELGELSPEEAAVHPQRHVLYRAIGQGEDLDIDTYHQPLPPGGGLLLCSDGLSGLVSEEEIGRIIASARTPQEACQRLLKAANDAGGPDNITALLVETAPD
jgi:serine/threonine protein phosphatase PrpC